MSLFNELKRRNVFRVAVGYIVLAWLLVQVGDVMFETFAAPEWVMKVLVGFLILGFPVALFLSWAFELTPEGLKLEKDVVRVQPGVKQTGRKLDFFIIAALSIGVVFLVLDNYVLNGKPESDATVLESAPEPEDVSVQSDVKTVAVLPFVNMSADADNEYFSDGLSEEILNALAKVDELKVISRTSAFAFKGKDIPLPDIASRLNATHIVEGSVRKAGNDLRITAQLIEVGSDSHLWSETYDRKLENVFEVQDEIANAIADSLQVTLGTGSGNQQVDIEAYELFLRGRHQFQQRGRDSLARAIEYLEQAIAIEPDFADAWANLAAAWFVSSTSGQLGYNEGLERATEAARRALDIDPASSLGHAALGMLSMSRRDFETGMRELKLATDGPTSDSNALVWRAIALTQLGYLKEAQQWLKQAKSVDPYSVIVNLWANFNATLIGDPEEVERTYRHSKEIDSPILAFLDFTYYLYLEDWDAAERVAANEEIAPPMPADQLERYARAYIAPFRDFSNFEEARQVMLELQGNDLERAYPFWLTNIGAVEEYLAIMKREDAKGVANTLFQPMSAMWFTGAAKRWSNPATSELFEYTGMADYWRKHGDPDWCTEVDGSFVCSPDVVEQH